MRLGEALSRCPELILIPPDVERSERAWEQVLQRLEGIGAEVDGSVPGFVWGIFVSLFVFFNCFAVNMWLQYRGRGVAALTHYHEQHQRSHRPSRGGRRP